MKKTFLLFLITMLAFSGCEKDDICDADTPTTPRLIIDFYDYNSPSTLKEVTDLKVIGDGMDEGVVLDSSASDDDQYLSNDSSISIPLKTDSDSATFQFILNYGSSTASIIDTDEITFNYTRNNVFVSRACGFKTVFTLDETNPFSQTAVPTSKDKWIKYITVEKSNIEDENETHIKVYF